jgi:glycine hydroxymethyltransferase
MSEFKQATLAEHDPELFDLLEHEKARQFKGLELIASENFTSRAVMEALGTCFTNKYSEGLPGKRYYGGNEFIDKMENLCRNRALAAFHLDKEKWGVNVQPYSGSTANFAAYVGLINPHDRIMGLDLPSGGHLTHGYYTAKKKISATSMFYESLPYKVDPETGYVDYDALEQTAMVFRPKVIVCGASAYPRDWDYARLRKIADASGAFLFTDMSHYSGLVATKLLKDPFEYSHIVTSTTHKSLRGPRSGMIFFQKDKKWGLEAKINFAVFPACQGGPHNNTIAAVATQLKEVATPQFKEYSQQVIQNAQQLAKSLMEKGYKMATKGTDNHLILWDLRPLGINGAQFEHLCDVAAITLNKNSIHGDTSALTPGGVRIGSPALTSRGFKEADFANVAEFLHRAVALTKAVVAKVGPKMKAFRAEVAQDAAVKTLEKDVETFAKKFYMPGFDASDLKYA